MFAVDVLQVVFCAENRFVYTYAQKLFNLYMSCNISRLAKAHNACNTVFQETSGKDCNVTPGVQVAKPREVRDAEQASSPVSDDTILRVITAFNVGVGKYTKLVRRLLPKYSGYECKEPESGKFTLSFRCDSSPLI